MMYSLDNRDNLSIGHSTDNEAQRLSQPALVGEAQSGIRRAAILLHANRSEQVGLSPLLGSLLGLDEDIQLLVGQ